MITNLLFLSTLIAAEAQSTPKGSRVEPLSAPDVYRKVAPSVVSIVVSGRDGKAQKSGSGIVIDTAGHILTNYHVVEGGVFFNVVSSSVNGSVTSLTARAAACSPDQDLAELELTSPKGFRAVKTAVGEPEIGSRVYAIGSPLQLEGTLTEGVVSQHRELGEQILIQTTAAISPGSSGGGLFNSRAELVGITTLSLSEGQNLNFAVSLAGLRALVPCEGFPVLIGKEPTSTATRSIPPSPLPCNKPALHAALRLSGGQDSFNSTNMTFSVTGWLINTGCQKARDIKVKIEIYRVDTDATVDVFSGAPEDSEIEVGRRSFIKITGTIRATEDATFKFRGVSGRFNLVDPATGVLIPVDQDLGGK